MAGVVLENVSRVYPGHVAAVDEVNLEVLDREFLVLVGPSGCGKTTTLRLIAGLEDLSGGKITIGTRVVNDVPPKDRDIAMVFQNYALYPHLTVYRNLAFGLELREGIGGWGRLWRWALPLARKAELAARRFAIAERVHKAARTLGIEDLLERYPRQLSGGERQRVALGRAIVRSPAVFLFDEPLSNLDAKLRVDMRRELKQLHRRLQTTMVYVTHDQVEALTLGDRIVVMNEGRIQQVGPPMEVYDWPANRFVAGFIGTPAMNFIQGTLCGGPGSWGFRRGQWKVDLKGRDLDGRLQQGGSALLGVRPEDVKIQSESQGSPAAMGTVKLLEELGDSSVITVEVLGNKWNAGESQIVKSHETCEVLSKMESRTPLRVGDWVSLHVNAQRVHVFDPQSGESWIRRPAAGRAVTA